MPKPLKHFLFQGVILSLWLLFVIFRLGDTQVEAQGSCTDPPDYKYLALNPGWSWYSGATVKVRLDSSFDESERDALKDGISKWNDGNCADVTFEEFFEKTFTGAEYTDDAPEGFFYWQKTLSGSTANAGTFYTFDSSLRTIGAKVKISVNITNMFSGTYFIYLGAHETGHTFNLNDCLFANGCSCVGQRSVMNGHGSISFNSNIPNTCDQLAVNAVYCPPSSLPTPVFCPSPSPSPTPTPDEEQDCYSNLGYWFNGTCNWSINPGCQPGDWGFTNSSHDCNGGGDWYNNCACYHDQDSPILIDINGNGFALSNAANGVRFDLSGSGTPKQFAWTIPGTDDAWLVLDRNGNGTVDNGQELFGNYTTQTEPPAGEGRNGFLALAQYDKPANGGNNDGKIKHNDSVFSSLRLWQDSNHNGISEAGELFTLSSLGLKTIHLDYQTKKKVDEFGNRFRYRAKVKDHQDAQLGRWAWDVFLVSQP